MDTLLIANRGEIARRVIRTARDLGIRTVAVHTAADADALHVHEADEAHLVPAYLDVDAIVAAAVASGADAVHPGYGFLSERAAFAEALAAAGIAFVGPSAQVIDQMGRKDRARELAEKAGVPVVPRGEDAGFPVLVKAAAGGGGKGMRVVRAADELAEAQAAAAREAAKAFGDDTLLLEKYVERGRHIEVQVFGDSHGNAVHLFERDCSTQRRHQKVLEEAPAPTLTCAQRELVTSSAVALTRAVGYVGAGTVEFLLDESTGEAYFLEMNTRLQVEHPVTEEVVRVRGGRVDLVALQLRVVDGQPLGFDQSDVTVEGHAIEARVYAEDAWNGFLPQAGTATHVSWPEDARVDHALESGQVVSTGFDPMLGKVIAWGEDREQARRRLLWALDTTEIRGLTTNTGFLRELVAGDAFHDASIDTAWLDRTELTRPDDTEARTAAAWAAYHREVAKHPASLAPDGWRDGGTAVPFSRHGITVSGREPRIPANVRLGTTADEVVLRGERYLLELPGALRDHVATAGDGNVLAPMPGTVLDVRVTAGQEVEAGVVLGVMEAMKMELTLTAPYAGTVTDVEVATGAQVALGARLFHVAPRPDVTHGAESAP